MSPIPIGGGGGGGGGTSPGFLSVNPASFAFGTVPVGTSSSLTVTVKNEGDLQFNVNTIAVGGLPYSVSGLPALPKLLRPGNSFTFTLTYSPTAAVVSNDALAITTSGADNSPFSGAISGTGIVAVVGLLTATPATIGFPDTVIAVASAGIVVTLKNAGAADLTLNSIALVGGASFALSGLPGMPLLMHVGDTTTFIIKFTPLSFLLVTDTVNVTTTANNPTIPVAGIGVQLTPVSIIDQNLRAILWSFSDNVPNVLHKTLDSTNVNGLSTSSGALTGSLFFNGAIWAQPGLEKKLLSVELFYENLGVATITLTVTSLRPSVGPDSFDTQTQSINIGTSLADQTERTSFFDIQLAGEILLFQLSRPVNGGPLSIIALLPEFEDGGEKVAGR